MAQPTLSPGSSGSAAAASTGPVTLQPATAAANDGRVKKFLRALPAQPLLRVYSTAKARDLARAQEECRQADGDKKAAEKKEEEKSEEEEKDDKPDEEMKDAPPKCPSAGHDMVIGGAAAYNRYVCEYCKGHYSGDRWFCKVCEDDICFKCKPSNKEEKSPKRNRGGKTRADGLRVRGDDRKAGGGVGPSSARILAGLKSAGKSEVERVEKQLEELSGTDADELKSKLKDLQDAMCSSDPTQIRTTRSLLRDAEKKRPRSSSPAAKKSPAKASRGSSSSSGSALPPKDDMIDADTLMKADIEDPLVGDGILS